MPAAMLVVICLLLSPAAYADKLRCGSKLVEEGMSILAVLARCGEPTSKTSVSEPVMARNLNGAMYQVGSVTKDLWRYDRGTGKFPAELTFVDSVLHSIRFDTRQ